jgi:hypothetical protein
MLIHRQKQSVRIHFQLLSMIEHHSYMASDKAELLYLLIGRNAANKV